MAYDRRPDFSGPISPGPRRRRPRPMARERSPWQRWLKLLRFRRALIVLGAACLVLLGTCSAPRVLRLVPLSGAEALIDQRTALPVLPTITPLPASVEAAPAPSAPSLLPSVLPMAATTAATGATIDAYMRDLTEQGLFSGAILVARDDTILISQGYGMANAEEGIPNTPETRFRLASLTKSFTAVSILLLQARGQLTINDPICSYLPDCPQAWQPVTVRHLLSHTSGIPSYTDFFDYAQTEMLPTTPEELVARFRDLPLTSVPGEQYYYSNSGYVLLGIIIERVSGQTYEDFLRANIFEPLQMTSTGYDHNENAIQGQANGYAAPGQPAPFLHASTLHAAGSLYSSAEDMYRWDQVLSTEYLIPADLIAEMAVPVQYDYGYGWKIGTTIGHRKLWHTGYINGFSNYIARYPDERVFVIVLSNLEISPSPTIGEYMAQLVFTASPAQEH